MPLHDALHLLTCLRPRRLANALKIWLSYHWSRLRGKPIMWGLPFSISVEPTTSCNLRCPECPSGLRQFSRPTGMLSLETYQTIVDQLANYLVYIILYFQGEPYLHPRLFDFIAFASRRRIYTAISTNAHYLHEANAKKTVESGLSRLIISIDGTTQDTYAQYRVGGNLNKVIEGAKNIVKAKKEAGSSLPHVIFQFLVVKPNQHQIQEIKDLAREVGVDQVLFKTAQVYDYTQGNPLIPTIERFSRYKRQPDGTYAIKNKLLNHCWKMWHSCVFTWDGQVVPCCFDKDATHPMGSVTDASFSDIWRSDNYHSFRKAILAGRNQIDICTNCTEGTRVWA